MNNNQTRMSVPKMLQFCAFQWHNLTRQLAHTTAQSDLERGWKQDNLIPQLYNLRAEAHTLQHQLQEVKNIQTYYNQHMNDNLQLLATMIRSHFTHSTRLSDLESTLLNKSDQTNQLVSTLSSSLQTHGTQLVSLVGTNQQQLALAERNNGNLLLQFHQKQHEQFEHHRVEFLEQFKTQQNQLRLQNQESEQRQRAQQYQTQLQRERYTEFENELSRTKLECTNLIQGKIELELEIKRLNAIIGQGNGCGGDRVNTTTNTGLVGDLSEPRRDDGKKKTATPHDGFAQQRVQRRSLQPNATLIPTSASDATFPQNNDSYTNHNDVGRQTGGARPNNNHRDSNKPPPPLPLPNRVPQHIPPGDSNDLTHIPAPGSCIIPRSFANLDTSFSHSTPGSSKASRRERAAIVGASVDQHKKNAITITTMMDDDESTNNNDIDSDTRNHSHNQNQNHHNNSPINSNYNKPSIDQFTIKKDEGDDDDLLAFFKPLEPPPLPLSSPLLRKNGHNFGYSPPPPPPHSFLNVDNRSLPASGLPNPNLHNRNENNHPNKTGHAKNNNHPSNNGDANSSGHTNVRTNKLNHSNKQHLPQQHADQNDQQRPLQKQTNGQPSQQRPPNRALDLLQQSRDYHSFEDKNDHSSNNNNNNNSGDPNQRAKTNLSNLGW